MAEEQLLPYHPKLPNPPDPENMADMKVWVREVSLAIQNLYLELAYRSNEIIIQGTFAQRPDATGRRRFYYATDTDKLYFDKGSWVEINVDQHTHTTGNPTLGQDVVLTYTP